MPRRVGYGRPGTTVFPPDWSASHAQVVEATFDCTVAIGPAGGSATWDDDERKTVTAPAAAVYTGAASITPMEGDADSAGVVAQDVVPTRAYQVKIPLAVATVEIGHIVTVTAAPDALLVDRLKVITVEKGSKRFSRILIAVDAD